MQTARASAGTCASSRARRKSMAGERSHFCLTHDGAFESCCVATSKYRRIARVDSVARASRFTPAAIAHTLPACRHYSGLPRCKFESRKSAACMGVRRRAIATPGSADLGCASTGRSGFRQRPCRRCGRRTEALILLSCVFRSTDRQPEGDRNINSDRRRMTVAPQARTRAGGLRRWRPLSPE